jgi:hypothetical protein
MRFSKFLREGIEHIEDLSIDEFVDTITNLTRYAVTEKLDGSALTFGIDEQGKLFTNRQQKGNDTPVYDAQQWGDSPAYVGFKSAHQALQKVESQLAKAVPAGVLVECEVLYGRQPNAIIYGTSSIAFLRAISEQSPAIIKKLVSLKLAPVQVETVEVTTEDGVSLVRKPTTLTWRFVTPQQIDAQKLKQIDFAAELNQLKAYVAQQVETSQGPMSIADVTRSTSKTREMVALRKQVAEKLLNDFKLPIKEKLLKQFVRTLVPSLRDVQDVEAEHDPGVEGVVMFDPKTNRQVKIVDKDVFSAFNQFNFAIRNQIKASVPRPVEGILKVAETRSGSIYGDLLEDLSTILNEPKLKTPRTIRAFLAAHDGKWAVDIKKARPLLTRALNAAENALVQAKDVFMQRADKLELDTDAGRKFKYSPEIIRRTLSQFADVITDIRASEQAVQSAKTTQQAVEILYKSYLGDK